MVWRLAGSTLKRKVSRGSVTTSLTACWCLRSLLPSPLHFAEWRRGGRARCSHPLADPGARWLRISLVNRTGDGLSAIEDKVQRVGELIDAVVTSSSEQSSAIGEINNSVHAMDEVIQHNSTMAEETNTACKGLNEQVHALEKIVSRFQTKMDYVRKAIAFAA